VAKKQGKVLSYAASTVGSSTGNTPGNPACNINFGATNPATQASLGTAGANGATGTTLCSHPNDKWGWAFLTDTKINAPWDTPGSRFGGFFQYGVGATAYAGGSNMSSAALFGGGNNVALGFVSDGVYSTPVAPNAANAVGCTGNIERPPLVRSAWLTSTTGRRACAARKPARAGLWCPPSPMR
jgi:hypothetical protein